MTMEIRTAYRLLEAGATAEEVRLLLAAEFGLDGREAEIVRVVAEQLLASGHRPLRL